MDKILDYLTIIGQFVVKYLPEKYLVGLDKTLPFWAIGLGAAIIFAFVLKVVTNIIFKIILWIALIIIFFIILQSFDIPIFDLISKLKN